MAVSRRRQFSAEKGICHMHDETITRLPDPSGFAPDALTDVIWAGARKLIEQAIEAELAALLAAFAAEKLADGRARLVRHGSLPEREVLTGIGPVAVKVPRMRDRGTGEEKISFTPQHPAPLPAQGEIGRGAAGVALPQGRVDGRFHRGAGGAPGAER